MATVKSDISKPSSNDVQHVRELARAAVQAEANRDGEVLTDFSQYARSRRKVTLPLPDGNKFRLQSLRTAEVKRKIKQYPKRGDQVILALALIDENGDTIVACTPEDMSAAFDEMDFLVFDCMVSAAQEFCTCQLDYEEIVKNSATT